MSKGNWSAPPRHRANGRHRTSRPTTAIGWAPKVEAAIGETVVVVADRDRLVPILSTLHGSGYGPNTRVLDGARGDLAAQLSRANIPGSNGDLNLGDRMADTAIVLVHAPGRGERVISLLSDRQFRDIQLFNRPTAPVDSVVQSWTDSRSEQDEPIAVS